VEAKRGKRKKSPKKSFILHKNKRGCNIFLSYFIRNISPFPPFAALAIL
jgi:hypothetical protein